MSRDLEPALAMQLVKQICRSPFLTDFGQLLFNNLEQVLTSSIELRLDGIGLRSNQIRLHSYKLFDFIWSSD